jgi:hypothetical protein
MVAAQSGKLYVIHYFTQISPNLRPMQFFPLRTVSSTLTGGTIYIDRWSLNVMAVVLNVTPDGYCIYCVVDVAGCEIVTWKNNSY